MKSWTPFLAPVLALLSLDPVFAARQTVTLEIPSMYCPVCPLTVKKALQREPGVIEVEVSFAAKEAIVTYDDEQTSPAHLMEATRNVGYPSTVKSGPGDTR
ncbi:MAG TPA: mercury resistance system periplasmic binding protein MerP [Methylococcus sp.]|nr:mercury resistance system periplasmic binding protein MerP [Methylococcus sp.]